jgi:membrane-bound serine protease (ClpP class)
MVGWLVLAIILYLACALTLVAEVFVPSGGLLTALALLFLTGGIYIFFHYSPVAGWVGVLLALVVVPVALFTAFKMLPHLKFGKNVVLEPTEREYGDGVPDSKSLRELIGKSGVCLTPLRPVGTCQINGRRIQCVAESGLIEKGQNISVVSVEGIRVVVAVIQNVQGKE